MAEDDVRDYAQVNAAESMAQSRPATFAPARILLVEDDPGVAMTLVDILESEGYVVRHVPGWFDVAELLTRFLPDLVMIDVELRTGGTRALCARLRSHVDAPIIVCRKPSASGRRPRADRLEADDVVAKPFQSDDLLGRIRTLLARGTRGQSRVRRSTVGTLVRGRASKPPAAPPRQRPAQNKPVREKKCILIVDDDPNIVQMLSDILTDEGYEVVGATQS